MLAKYPDRGPPTYRYRYKHQASHEAVAQGPYCSPWHAEKAANPEQSEQPPLQQSIMTSEDRGHADVTSARNVVA